MNALASFYSRFRVADRLLLTGHSHQAWPDVAFDAQQRAWLDAAALVDAKWERAEAQAALVRAGFARLLGVTAEEIALGQNTHELVTRWLSALTLRDRPRLVTTDGEFHSLRRQLDRIAEERLIDVVKVSARPVETLAERLAAAVSQRTAAVMVSSVLFDTAAIVPHLDHVATACMQAGAELLIDAYHHLNVIPFDVREMNVESAFITGGGYKYCQLGEGNAFLRVPPGRQWRPVLTGWFAEFAGTRQPPTTGVTYPSGAAAFSGATYDPTSNYRAAAVFDFHHGQHLDAPALRSINQAQVRLLKDAFERLDVDSGVAHIEPMPDDLRGGFVALRATDATAISVALASRGVSTDARGDVLRLGPAPYLSDVQLGDAIGILGEVLAGFQAHR
ncbi:MAG TPA: aminotransferase class V-fold PLP-dependent enzyme [Vicinamibacterales bacterium]|nr:aminotransferase class V-fold PLP-dependent enzyme [Vicinamibacterales bacterium]